MSQAGDQQTIAPRDFTANQRMMQRVILVSSMTRLADVLASRLGEIRVELSGRIGALGEPLLTMLLGGALQLACQRCLEPVNWTLDLTLTYEFREDVSALSQADLEDDSRDFLAIDEPLDVLSLVEDEVLLNLPFAPRHEDCEVPGGDMAVRQASPFGALAALKKGFH